MTQKVVNGFPQYFAYTYLTGKFYGTPTTQSFMAYTDIDLQSQLVGDGIGISLEDSGLISIFRDGAFLHQSQGYDIVGSNVIRVFPGLLDTETIEVKKLTGASGVVSSIPVAPPVSGTSGYVQSMIEATVYTDNSIPSIRALPPIVFGGKTRITAEFLLNEGRVDVYINGYRSSSNDSTWTIINTNTIELSEDFSTVKMKVDIIKQKVG
jgi:hypothetical protein